MEFNVILAGVGGQGILSIARAVSLAAMRRGWSVKQSEVHGMSQRGGAVQAHLRLADHELYSDLIPYGSADMILSVEPLEALRYVQYLTEGGCIVSNACPFVNISNYPPIEQILDQVGRCSRHVLVDADRLARSAGTVRAMNMVMLGAASFFMEFQPSEFEGPVTEMFGAKGPAVVEANLRAVGVGRAAARAYWGGLRRGGTPRMVRAGIESLSAEQLLHEEAVESALPLLAGADSELSEAEAHAVTQTLDRARRENRAQLYEHEVYALVELVGAISPPQHLLIRKGESMAPADLARFPGERVVLKTVSANIVHKSEAGGVVFAAKDPGLVDRQMQELIRRHEAGGATLEGVLVVEFVEQAGAGFGRELFVGIRASREFGPVIAAGLGGVDTEYLAAKMQPGVAVAKAVVADVTADQFFELFQSTAAYELLAGRVRGHQRAVADGELLCCFRAFLALARRFCVHRGHEGPNLLELEVNPFAFVRQRMVPLDGRGRIGPVPARPTPRPEDKIGALLTPRSIAVMGVSSRRANFGRIILNNIRDCGFPGDRLYVIKDQAEAIDGIRCLPEVGRLPERVDLLVIATAAKNMPHVVDQIIDSGKVSSVIIIPGGLGEKEGTQDVESRVRRAIAAARGRPDGGPVFLGANCLGIRSRPGRYDTFFIEDAKLDPRRHAPPRRAALISQSGAFIITRMSNLQFLDPAFAVSVGNQIDLTVSDMLRAVGRREDVDCIGVYVEGFNDLDGLSFLRAVEEASAAGKEVVFYKAGRTERGRGATAGHTASIAGDYDVCDAAAAQAGAIVVDTFKEFEQLMELATALHDKPVRGRRIGAISNAGYETVGMADAILGRRYRVEMPPLSAETRARLADALAAHRLEALVNVTNPLDLTPMADDQVYEDCLRAVLADEGIDAVVVSVVPLTPQMLTTPEQIDRPGSIARRLPAVFRESPKPLVAVIDCGPPFEELARSLREAGLPVFRSCDQAVRSLGRYLCHRAAGAHIGDAAAARQTGTLVGGGP